MSLSFWNKTKLVIMSITSSWFPFFYTIITKNILNCVYLVAYVIVLLFEEPVTEKPNLLTSNNLWNNINLLPLVVVNKTVIKSFMPANRTGQLSASSYHKYYFAVTLFLRGKWIKMNSNNLLTPEKVWISFSFILREGKTVLQNNICCSFL